MACCVCSIRADSRPRPPRTGPHHSRSSAGCAGARRQPLWRESECANQQSGSCRTIAQIPEIAVLGSAGGRAASDQRGPSSHRGPGRAADVRLLSTSHYTMTPDLDKGQGAATSRRRKLSPFHKRTPIILFYFSYRAQARSGRTARIAARLLQDRSGLARSGTHPLA